VKLPAHVVNEAQAAVDKGAALLDRRRPNWFTQINCKTLDLSCGCDCVVGQLYGSYNDTFLGRLAGTIFPRWGVRATKFAERHAFVTTPAMDEWVGEAGYWATVSARSKATWHLLDRLWIEKIKERLAA